MSDLLNVAAVLHYILALYFVSLPLYNLAPKLEANTMGSVSKEV